MPRILSGFLLGYLAATKATAMSTEQGMCIADSAVFEPPVVDLNSSKEVIYDQLRSACATAGIIYVANHGIAPEKLATAFKINAEFFSLSPEQKQAYLGIGYSQYKTETLDPKHQVEGDNKEAFSIKTRKPLSEDPDLNLPTRWHNNSAMNVMANMKPLFIDLTNLTINIGTLFANALGLPLNVIEPFLKESPSRYLRMFLYPQKSAPDAGKLGAGRHTDYGALTAVIYDAQPGLQVELNNCWHDIPPKPGLLIINIGDMFEIFSNGTCLSPVHRVSITHLRHSFAYFLNGNEKQEVKPLVQNPDPNPTRTYRATTFRDYLAGKINETFAGASPNHNATRSNRPALTT